METNGDDSGMDEERNLKQQLPAPYNRDLSERLSHLDRRTPFGRSRLANDPVTAAYLCAGMRLIERNLGPGAEHQVIDPMDGNALERPVLGFLSQRKVAAEVANNPDPFPRMGNTSTLRSRWKTSSDYIADLVSFALWAEHAPPGHEERLGEAAERLVDGADCVEAIHDLAYLDTSMVITMPSFRLQLAALAAAEDDQVIREAISDYYRDAGEPWKQVYAAFLEGRGLRLRDGITLDQFADIMTAVAEGVTTRAVGDPGAHVVDHSEKRSLLGTAAMALVLGCFERADGFSGTTLEQAVRCMVHGEAGEGEARPRDGGSE